MDAGGPKKISKRSGRGQPPHARGTPVQHVDSDARDRSDREPQPDDLHGPSPRSKAVWKMRRGISPSSTSAPFRTAHLLCSQVRGGFVLTFPIVAGSGYWLSSPAGVLTRGARAVVIRTSRWNTRMHDLSDGFALPGPCSVPNVVPSIARLTSSFEIKRARPFSRLMQVRDINLTSAGNININGNVGG